jgi:ferredoxin
LPGCGVAVCEPLKWHPRDFVIIKQRLEGSDWLHLLSSASLYEDTSEVQEFVNQHSLTALVVVGPGDRAGLSRVAKVAESAGVPRFAIQTVPLQLYRLREDGVMGETWALAAAAHARKAEAATFASKARTTFSGDTRIGRRELLFSLPRMIAEPVEDPVMVPELCSPFHKTCRHCSDACLYSAISHEGPTARIDPIRCVHCGACAAVCPSGALQSPVFSDDEYRAVIREFASRTAGFENPLVVFTSDRGISMLEAEAKSGMGLQEGMIVVRSPSAAPLGWSHYLWAASANVPVLSVCPAEELAGHPEVAGAEDRASAARQALRGSYKTLVGHRSLRPSEKLSDVCIEAAQGAIRRLGDSFTPPGPRMDAMLGVRLAVVSEAEVRLPGANSFDVSVDDRCTLCGTCTIVCPTKAFRTSTRDRNIELRFYPSQCTGCGICVKECPEDAMAVSRAFSPDWLDFRRFAVKAHDSVELCSNCRKEIGSSSSLKKLHDSLAGQGLQALADSVYLCQDCKANPTSNRA